MSTTFADWLRAHVSARHWRQEDLARAAGVSQQTASRWLLGQAVPAARSVRALAMALGVSTDEVLQHLGRSAKAEGDPGASEPRLAAEVVALRQRVAQLEAQLARRRLES